MADNIEGEHQKICLMTSQTFTRQILRRITISARHESNGFDDIQWFKYKSVTQEYAEKNAIKSPWGDILYRGLPPKNRAEAVAQDFYRCMVRGPQPENADPSSLLWCRDDNLFKRNFQHAKASAKENKKSLD